MANGSSGGDDYNHGGLLAFIFSMGAVLALIFWLSFFNKGVVMDEKVVDPNTPTEAAAGPVFDMAKVTEPWVSTPEIIAYGKKFYSTNCAMCHGPEGKGDGPAGGGLNPKPRNFVEGKWTKGGNLSDHFNVITNGIAGSSMAAFGHFKAHDRWAVVHFIESITENKSKEDPTKLAEFAKTAK